MATKCRSAIGCGPRPLPSPPAGRMPSRVLTSPEHAGTRDSLRVIARPWRHDPASSSGTSTGAPVLEAVAERRNPS